MATDGKTQRVRRYNWRTRWFHAGIYLTVLVLLGTGGWLLFGREGEPSPLARVTSFADTTTHEYTGWALVALAALGVTWGARGAGTFIVESLRYRRSDLHWFRGWPGGAFTGRFGYHDGHFDPGQRIANLVLVLLLAILAGSGVGLTLYTGGPTFVLLDRVHRWATYAITPVLAGHIVIAAGVLPGYRGVARAMHLGGRLSVGTARRVWPGWLQRQLGEKIEKGTDLDHVEQAPSGRGGI